MQLLITHIWIALATAGAIGLLAGWIIQASIGAGKRRRALVERDVVRTELEQARAEIDGLYMAQRRASEAEAAPAESDPVTQNELQAREAMIKSLGNDLATARSQIEALKRQRTDAASTETPSVPPRPMSSNTEGDASLLWRNRYLESRVRTLESEAQKTLAPKDVPVQTVAPQPIDPPPPTTEPSQSDEEAVVSQAKLHWQNEYLRQRLRVLEENAVSMAAKSAPKEVQSAPLADEDLTPELMEQELARLRWRTRFLEGRLAYAGGGEASQSDNDKSITSSPSVSQEAGQGVSPEPPMAQEEPADGGDDLTLIDGIGGRLAGHLNTLGIWTFRQVASWSAEHASWIDHRLGFEGRVERERWIEQAGVLAAGGGHA